MHIQLSLCQAGKHKAAHTLSLITSALHALEVSEAMPTVAEASIAAGRNRIAGIFTGGGKL